MAIEKVIHQIWDGDNVPFQLRILSCTWKRFNPNWDIAMVEFMWI